MSSSEQESYVRNNERADELEQRKSEIRRLNDRLRNEHSGGHVTVTYGIRSLELRTVSDVVKAVRLFDTFTPDNDPHEFGAVECAGHRILWKIDYYDKRLEFGSPDPADPAVTTRVLTIMLAEEY
jgi:hypothetical protein